MKGERLLASAMTCVLVAGCESSDPGKTRPIPSQPLVCASEGESTQVYYDYYPARLDPTYEMPHPGWGEWTASSAVDAIDQYRAAATEPLGGLVVSLAVFGTPEQRARANQNTNDNDPMEQAVDDAKAMVTRHAQERIPDLLPRIGWEEAYSSELPAAIVMPEPTIDVGTVSVRVTVVPGTCEV